MFPSEEEPSKDVKKRHPLNKNVIAIGGGLLALCLVILAAFMLVGGTSVAVPEAVKEKVKSPIYLPSKLPDNYKLDESSFSLVEQDTVLIFNAEDSANGKLIFSEQPKPKDLDFDNLYQGKFENAQTLNDVPYPSVWGKSADGRVALSVVTDDTWIIMVTALPLGQDDMAHIAKSIYKLN